MDLLLFHPDGIGPVSYTHLDVYKRQLLDGDAPHAQRGCDAQAWGVTEGLRVAAWLETARD